MDWHDIRVGIFVVFIIRLNLECISTSPFVSPKGTEEVMDLRWSVVGRGVPSGTSQFSSLQEQPPR